MATRSPEGSFGGGVRRKEGGRRSEAQQRRKETVVVGHWNITSLREKSCGGNIYSICHDKLNFLKQYMIEHGIDILGLSETHVFHEENSEGVQELHDERFRRFLSNKQNEPTTKKASRLDFLIEKTEKDGPGVGILVKNRANYEYYVVPVESPGCARIIAVVLKALPGSSTKGILIIEVYAPTDRLEPTNKEDRDTKDICDGYVRFRREYKNQFFKTLQKLLDSTRQYDVSDIILMGDFNCNVGMGMKPGFPIDQYDNASLLLTFCKKNDLMIVNPASEGLNYIILQTTKGLRLSVTQFKHETPSSYQISSEHALISANVVFKVGCETSPEYQEDLGSRLHAMNISGNSNRRV